METIGARIWDATTGERVADIPDVWDFAARDLQRAVPGNPFSADSRYVVLPLRSARSGVVGVWDVESGAQRVQLSGHRGAVRFARFSPSGETIVTAGDDETVRLWNAESGVEFLTLTEHDEPVQFATFTPDGQRVASASSDGTARICIVDPLPLALARKPRELTPAERSRFELESEPATGTPAAGDSAESSARRAEHR
jgi:WD40 repeat protein